MMHTEPEFPLCRCKGCGVTFRDPLEIYPGPALCPQCQDEARERRRRVGGQRARYCH